MSKEKSIVKKALEFCYSFTESHADLFVFHNYKFVNESISVCKEIARAEDIEKEDYEMGLVALILNDMGIVNAENKEIDNATLINDFVSANEFSEKEKKQIEYYIDFFRTNKIPQNQAEEALRDGKDIHLGMPDALERLSLLRIELEKVKNKTYSDLQWDEFCKQYFITHSFYTRYATRQYGAVRSKNYFELEKRIDKLQADLNKERKYSEKSGSEEILSDKESEDLFKIAFRNYLNLVALADRKAGLLIQVNSIIASVIIAFFVRQSESLGADVLINQEEGVNIFVIPIAMILLVAAITILCGILASKPLERAYKREVNKMNSGKEHFFFGSFDRLDPDFKHVTWEKYSADISQLFRGDKKSVFDELIKESFQVRKVLSKKFGYLDIAYKVFFGGLVICILSFLIIFIIKS